METRQSLDGVGAKNKNTLKRTKIKSMNTDAVSMLKIKKPKIPQFEIIFTYSYYNHAIKLPSRCSTKFVGSSTPPRWILGGSNLVHDTTTTMPGPCSEKSPSPREGVLRGVGAPQAFRRGEHMDRVGFDPRSFSPLDGRSPVSHPTCDVPFPPRRSGEHRKGTIPARPYATRTNGEWGYSTRNLCWATCAQGRCHPKEALYLPTFTVIY